jgi:ABC-type dipeptide/oligopeptide/nickel transport system permease subunit
MAPRLNTVELKRVHGQSLWRDAVRRLWHDKAAMACFAVVVIYAIVAIVGPYIFLGWNVSQDYANRNIAPSLKYPLGTDALGRSVLIKTLLGAHVSMTVGFMANIIAVPLGMLLGAVAGYYGRKIDDLITWFYTTLASIPGIILLIALKFAFENKVLFGSTFFAIDLSGMPGVYLALGIISWIDTCRLVRAETLKIKELDYVMAARACGMRSFSILLRHVVPNVLHIGIIYFSLGFVGAISAEVILSFLNLGVQDLPSWGKMINDARNGSGCWALVGADIRSGCNVYDCAGLEHIRRSATGCIGS